MVSTRGLLSPTRIAADDLGVEQRLTAVADAYLRDLRIALETAHVDGLAEVMHPIVTAMETGGRVLIAGNGGSSTTAAHMSSDLNAAAYVAAADPGYTHCLADNGAFLTAVANDATYDEAFSRQVELLGRAGDVFVGISVSGASPSLLAAAEAAHKAGLRVVSFLGAKGPQWSLSDHAVIVGGGDYGLTEDLHLAINHMMVRAIRRVDRYVCPIPPSTPE